jgi:hypothetical protein
MIRSALATRLRDIMPGSPGKRRRTPKPGFQALHRNFSLVSKTELRQLFTTAGILKRRDNGELTEVIVRDGVPSPLMGQAVGTRSQRVAYIDADGQRVAEVHRYLNADGTLGGSGQPDPKEVFYQGVWYYCDP